MYKKFFTYMVAPATFAAFLLAASPMAAFAQSGDEAISKEIKERISANPSINPVDILVVSDDGAVKIRGVVDDYETIGLVGSYAETVSGVTSVENTLSVRAFGGSN